MDTFSPANPTYRHYRAFAVLSGLGALALSRDALAQTAPEPAPVLLKLTIEEVLAKKLAVPATIVEAALPPGLYNGLGCTIEVKSGTPRTINGPSTCDALWHLDPGRPFKLELTHQGGARKLQLEFAAVPTTRKAVASGDKLRVELTSGEKVYQRSKAGIWEEVVGDFHAIEGSSYWVVSTGKPPLELVLPEEKKDSAKDDKTPPIKYPNGPLTLDSEALQKCRADAGWDYASSLCFRVGDRLQPQLVYAPRRLRDHILPPNTVLNVHIVHAEDVDIEVQLGGQRGFSAPGTDERNVANSQPLQPEPPKAPTIVVFHKSFSPRLPDTAADLTVKATKDTVSGQETLELFVERTYSGALRVGLGLIVGPGVRAIDRDYKAVRVDNSMQYEVVASKGGRLEYELVVGYAPFLFDGRKGRAYTSTKLSQRAYGFAPYIGLGVLNVASPTGLEFLKSVHLGLEWEPQRNVAFAFTVIARRITELRPGSKVGSPVASAEPPTRERIAFGMGIVINFTPEFLRFATRGSASLLRGTKE